MGRRARRLLGRHPAGYLFVAPYVAFVVAIFAYPLGYAVYMSLHDYFFAAPGAVVDRPYVGLRNYREVFRDPAVRSAVGHVLEFAAIYIPLSVAGALVLASALNRVRGSRLFQTIFYLPYVSSSVALIAAWLIMLSGDGVVNAALGGLAPDPTWLVNRHLVIPVIGVFGVIKWLGFYVVVYLAALRAVPQEQYEAAMLDGAGVLKRFWYITVPGVRRTTALVAILTVVNAANLFTEPLLMTGQGGPAGASTSPVLLIYQAGIQRGDVGYAAAMGVLLTVLVMAVSAVAGKLIDRD